MTPSGLQAVIAAIRGDSRLSPEISRRNCLLDDSNVWLTYEQTIAEAGRLAERLRAYIGGVAIIAARNDNASVLALLASWSAGLAVALIDSTMEWGVHEKLRRAFRPEIIYHPSIGLAPTGGRYAPVTRGPFILLSTSGTTGTNKFVRLPESAMLANARQIAEVLDITADDVAVAHLPLHYSYGLSVLLSHLERGAGTFLTEAKVTSPDFREKIEAAGGTHFPGVPFHYTVLARLGLDRATSASVTTFTQAGGHLDQRFREIIYKQVSARNSKFFVMYGQTEAAPRMTTLASEMFPGKPNSVGRAMPGGKIEIVDEQGSTLPAGAVGQIVYCGPNVMWGYATSRECLGKRDEMHGRLETGDIGWLDADGFLFISGRNNRFAKIAGLRIGLDEIERLLKPDFEVALVPDNDSIIVFFAVKGTPSEPISERLARLAEEYRIPMRSFEIRQVEAIPILSSGKVDFTRLRGIV